MEINFITSNEGKVKELKKYLEPGVKVNHVPREYRELRSDDPGEIAREAAERLAKEAEKPVVVEDSGLFITALNGFPGTCSSYIHKRIGLQGILKLMESVENRACYYRCAIAHCKPNEKATSFLGEEKGSIAKEERGSYGFGHDPIFIPEGYKATYGEMENCENLKKFRKKAAEELKKFLVKG